MILKNVKQYSEIPEKRKLVESVLKCEKAFDTRVQFARDEADSEQLQSDEDADRCSRDVIESDMS